VTARFAYTVTCTGCRAQWHGEAHSDSVLLSDPLDDLEITCPRCGPLDWEIARRPPASPEAERRQVAKPRTPMRGTPRARGLA
jgi:hypothetical protein